MILIDWNEFLTPDFYSLIAQRAGISEISTTEQLRTPLLTVFNNHRTYPLLERRLTIEDMHTLMLNIVDNACNHLMSVCNMRKQIGTHMLKPEKIYDYNHRIDAFGKVNINTANKDELNMLPGIGNTLAVKIIEERNAHGLFGSLKELDARILGIGHMKIEELNECIYFNNPLYDLLGFIPNENIEEHGLTSLMKLMAGTTQDERISKLFYVIAAECATNPNPLVEQFPLDHVETQFLNDAMLAEFVGLLEDEKYYDRMLSLIAGSQSRIWICMFHISTGNNDHPTTKLLEALLEAKNRGVDVRVLMDQDRTNDPYLSTIINSGARRFLKEHGISVKFDTSDKLLHSKVVIIDGKVTVLGSHNWTAGSFFQFHDMSFEIHSHNLNSIQSERFESLWKLGE